MITGFIINAFYILFYNIINVMPEGNGIPTDWVNSLHSMWGYLNAFSFIFPIDDIVAVLLVSLTFELGIILFKVVSFIIRTVRGSGS